VKLGCASAAAVLVGCSTAGSAWVAEPPSAAPDSDPRSFSPPAPERAHVQARTVKRIVEPEPTDDRTGPAGVGIGPASIDAASIDAASRGVELGTFRNTYYNFPDERDYRGPETPLFDSQCQPLARVPRAFHDTLCVQGSGSLETGQTVSFARRGCRCARTCPRSGQKICFATLDRDAFPWGRGAAGTAIVPLRSVAVDIKVIALGTRLFIPEFVGLPLDRTGNATHDGCFLAEDRGIKVVGQHVDIFTGAVAMTKVWDDQVPTNQGVTVYVDSPHCAHVPTHTPDRAAPTPTN
jgi:3D (Asp-Asp-Asp) domain-containing protein